MNLRVERNTFSPNSTMGSLLVDGEFQAYTLEPPWRTDGQKPRAIPEGTFPLRRRNSAEHHCPVPGVEDVPGFSDIEIHWGNYPHDTKACLLVGRTQKKDFVGESKAAFFDLMEILKPVWDSGETIDITYVNKQAKSGDTELEVI